MNKRELDAAVAEKVMGWKWIPSEINDEQKILVPNDGSAYPHPKYTSWWWGRDVRDLVPAYSTDISAAWLVVEKFLPHFRIEYYEDSDYTDKKGWHADFWLESGHGCADGCATAPLAICRAALKALEDK